MKMRRRRKETKKQQEGKGENTKETKRHNMRRKITG